MDDPAEFETALAHARHALVDDLVPGSDYACLTAMAGVVVLSVLAWRHSPQNGSSDGSTQTADAPYAGVCFGSTLLAAIFAVLGIAGMCAGRPWGVQLWFVPIAGFGGFLVALCVWLASAAWSRQMLETRNPYAAILLWTPAMLGCTWVLLTPFALEDCPEHIPANDALPFNRAMALLCDRKIQIRAYTEVMTDDQEALGWHRYVEEMHDRGRPVEEMALWSSRMRRLDALAAPGSYLSAEDSTEVIQLFERISVEHERLRETVEHHPSLATENDEILLRELNRFDIKTRLRGRAPADR